MTVMTVRGWLAVFGAVAAVVLMWGGLLLLTF